jgi:hypothetical protein
MISIPLILHSPPTHRSHLILSYSSNSLHFGTKFELLIYRGGERSTLISCGIRTQRVQTQETIVGGNDLYTPHFMLTTHSPVTFNFVLFLQFFIFWHKI